MRKKSKVKIPSKYLLMILSFFCVIMIFLTFTANIPSGPVKNISGYIFVPLQKGINVVGSWLSDKTQDLKNLRVVLDENEILQEKVDELTIENSVLKQELYELDNLRTLYELDQKYPGYTKVAARVFGKDAGNWFNSFLIDKGSSDGLEKDMNVIAGSGLVGIITEVGSNWSRVRSVIDDSSNISGMVLTTSDRCIVSGSLKSMKQEQTISVTELRDPEDKIQSGDQIVTSHISDKYLQGILIGYINKIEKDANNLTKSGTITPVVDFEHLEEVLVILEKKQTAKE